MTVNRRWTDEDRDLLISLRRQGLSYRAIARRLGCSTKQLRSHVEYHGLAAPGGPLADSYGRQGYDDEADTDASWRRWTPREDELLTDLRLDGRTYAQISQRMNRTVKAVEYRAMVLGLTGTEGIVQQIEQEFASDYVLMVDNDGWCCSIARGSKQEIERIYRSMFPAVLGLSIEPAPPGLPPLEREP